MLELRAGNANVNVLCLYAFVLGFGLSDVDVGGDSALEAHLGEVEVVQVGDDGVVEELLLGVEAAEFEVVQGEFGAEAELDVGEIGGAGLSIGARLLDGAADLSPEVRLPENLTGESEGVVGEAFGRARRVIGCPLSRD